MSSNPNRTWNFCFFNSFFPSRAAAQRRRRRRELVVLCEVKSEVCVRLSSCVSIRRGGTAAHGHGHGGHKSDMSDGEDEASGGHLRTHAHHSHGGSACVPIRESPRGGGGGGGGLGGGGGGGGAGGKAGVGARGHYGLMEVICGRGRGEGGGDDTHTPGADLPMWRLEGFQTLVGILVHSFADGAAVGVAALSPNRGLGILVAVAIIMHKAPAAFGLCTYLLNTGWDLGRTRRAMAIFSMASPLSALLVYLTISSLPVLNQPLSVRDDN